MFTHHSGSKANGGCGDCRGPSLDAKSDCHQIRKNAGVFLSVLFWCIIFEQRSLVIIRFLWCLRRSTSELLTYTVTIGFADITLSLAIIRLTMKQSCWRRTLVTMTTMTMNFTICGLVPNCILYPSDASVEFSCTTLRWCR